MAGQTLRVVHSAPAFYSMTRQNHTVGTGRAYGCNCEECGRETQAPLKMQKARIWCLYCGMKAGHVPAVEVPPGVFEFSFGATHEECRMIARAVAAGGSALDDLALSRGRELGHVIDIW